MGCKNSQSNTIAINRYELTTQQNNISDLQKFYEGTAISNICCTIIYDEARDLEKLESSIRQVIASQTALRLRFSNTDPVSQYLAEDDIDIDIKYFSDEAELDAFACKTAREPMRMYDSPMCAFTLFSLGTRYSSETRCSSETGFSSESCFSSKPRSGIVAKLNHLIADAWSFGLLADQIDAHYAADQIDAHYAVDRIDTHYAVGQIDSHYAADQKDTIYGGHEEKSGLRKTILSGDYLSYAQDEHKYRLSERYEKDRRFWEEKYQLRPENCGIKLFEAARAQDISAKRIYKKISAGLSRQIKSFCSESKVTEAIVFESAVLLYLSRINPEVRTCTIGVPVLNRNKLKEKQTVGMFISTMPLKADINASGTVRELLETVSSAKREMFRHQRYPYEEILRTVRNNHGFTGNLYDVMVSVQNSRIHGDYGFHTKWYPNGYCEVPFVLSVDQRDSENEYAITADYQTAVFPDEREVYAVVERIEWIISQIAAIAAEEDLPLSEIDILPEREKDLLLNKFNNTYADYPAEKCVHELFAEQVKRTPDSAALIFEGQTFTYKQIDEMSDALACFLRGKGVRRNEVIPIIARRDWRIIAAMLAVLKAGGAYMPVSHDYPLERVKTMLKIAESRVALCYDYDKELDYNQEFHVEKIDLTGFDFDKKTGPVENINSPDDLCYIIFTSGSTGEPKGVCVTHSNVANYAHNNDYNVVNSIIREGYQTIVSVTNFVFDIFVTESLLPLINGLTVCLANDDETVSQKKLAPLIEKKGVEVIQTTPTKMRSYLMDKRNLSYLKGLKAIAIGGEAFLPDLYTELREVTDARIFNIYGPAETTVWSSIVKVKSADGITIGCPIANTQIYIVDSSQKLLPVGAAGELCIAGAGVGKGYLNRPGLTAERFIPNPFRTEENGHGEVLYRTGDLARWRMDGEIEYLGRIDTQVKIRGLRIELGEVESAMNETEGIGLVAAAAQKDGAGRQYLVGYYTSEDGIDEKAMRKRLTEKLPKYMVPNYFMRLETMPMTASGKTDRKNLPVPDINLSERQYVPPATDTEKILCAIIAEVLSLDRVGVTDDFFELGGDSLGAISVAALAHEKGIEVGLQTLFDHPDVRDLCAGLENSNTGNGQTAAAEAHGKSLGLPPQDLERYKKLLQKNTIDASAGFDGFEKNTIDASAVSDVFEKKDIGNVFLTGATGFLGAHVLDALMKEADGKIYCLVRRGQDQDPCQRLADSLKWYFGDIYTKEIGGWIIPVEGDIEIDGLSDMLPEDVQTVIHTAATVKHYGAYDFFKKINVEGTRHAADYARRIGAEFIHISTVSVSGNALADAGTVYRSEKDLFFDETDFYIGQPLENVYIRSKFEAEKLVLDEILDHGLKAKIIRVGNLTNRASDLRFQSNYESNAFLRRLKAILELGLFPDYLLPLYSEFSPVDLTAEGIVKITQYAKEQTVFHLYSNKPLMHERMLSILRTNGISLKTVSGEEFHKGVEQSLQSKEKEFIFKTLHIHMDPSGRLIYDTNIHIKNDFTTWFMSQIGFEWNEIDEDYVKGYLEYFRKAGFFSV